MKAYTTLKRCWTCKYFKECNGSRFKLLFRIIYAWLSLHTGIIHIYNKIQNLLKHKRNTK